MKESLEKNRPYYRGMIDGSKKYSECKIYLLIKPKFMSPTDANEKRMMYSQCGNRIIMTGKIQAKSSIKFLIQFRIRRHQKFCLWQKGVYMYMDDSEK